AATRGLPGIAPRLRRGARLGSRASWLVRHYCADEAGARRETVEVPAAALAVGLANAQDARRLIRLQRDVEGVEGMGKAFAERFDERLLAGPAVEEAFGSLGGRQSEEGAMLRAREGAARDVRCPPWGAALRRRRRLPAPEQRRRRPGLPSARR